MRDKLRGSVGVMHGRYRSPAGRSKLVHHAVCAVREEAYNCTFDELLSCYSAIILLSPSVFAIVHSVEIIYFLKFLTI